MASEGGRVTIGLGRFFVAPAMVLGEVPNTPTISNLMGRERTHVEPCAREGGFGGDKKEKKERMWIL